ncbi:MAG: restriction endonuclease subunit S [Verrucomicrobiae bacterium]|nr:restriction endonuclease subunit S [Verrucomicrobiae bacterium]
MKEWNTVRLGDVIAHRKEFIDIDDLQIYKRPRVQLHAKGIVLRDVVEGALIKTKRQQVCQAGEFLVAEIDAKVGGFGIVPEQLGGALVSSHYFLFTIDETKLDRSFLDYFIRTPAFRDQVEAQGSTNYAAIRPAHVLGYEIPLPPLAEQRRIVARIEALAAQIDEAKRLRKEAVEEAEALFGAEAGKRLTDCFPTRRMDELCSLVTDGTHQTPRYVEEGGHTFLSAQNVKPFRFMPEVHRKVSTEDYEGCIRRAAPKRGDVLMTRVGAGIGEAAVMNQDLDFAFYVSLALMRPDPEFILPEYLVHWLNSPDGRASSRRETLGKGHSQGNLNLKLLRGFNVPLPPLPEQRRIVAELDALQAEVDGLKHLQSETAAELDALLPAILDRAFKGQL